MIGGHGFVCARMYVSDDDSFVRCLKFIRGIYPLTSCLSELKAETLAGKRGQ